MGFNELKTLFDEVLAQRQPNVKKMRYLHGRRKINIKATMDRSAWPIREFRHGGFSHW